MAQPLYYDLVLSSLLYPQAAGYNDNVKWWCIRYCVIGQKLQPVDASELLTMWPHGDHRRIISAPTRGAEYVEGADEV